MKNLLTKFLIVLLFTSCSGDSEDSTIVTKDPDPDPIPVKITDPFKKLISEGYNTDTFKFGATLNFFQFNTNVETLFLKEFDYLVAENSFKQTIVHPEPNVWNWERADAFLDFANKNNLQLRVHGPIGPQSSNWAKTDSRTKDELIKNYEEFLTELCKKVNSEENVKWMDVVNETIDKEGKWTIEKTGTDYQNPWTQIGNNEDGIPLYIIRSFEIAKEYAPNVSLVFNQHQGMQPVMWDKVKETILYLKNKGLKIDGLGWQSHLRDNVIMSLNKENIDYLMSLIDWAHQNDLDFHVTEIDYKMTGDPPTSSEYERQANGYSNILKALIAKRDSGVVTFNTWGVYDKNEVSEHQYKYIYDSNLNPKKAVDLLKSTLKNKNTTPKYLDN